MPRKKLKIKEEPVEEAVLELKKEVELEQAVAPVVEVVEKPNWVVVTKGVKQYKKFSRPDGTTFLEGPIN